MKKTKLFIFIVLLISMNNIFAQDYVIEYNHIIKFETNITEAVYKLETNNKESVYYLIKNDYKDLNNNEIINANEGVTPFIYKNFYNKNIIYNQPIINKIKFIKESLPLQSWKLTDEIKNIQSFKCKKATTSYRGRIYTAWFTEELSIIGGPWKFDGLPGIILSISSDDDVIKIDAIKIEKKNDLVVTKFSFDEKNLISWDDYCLKYLEVIERIKKNMKADSDTDVDYELKIDLVEDIGYKK